MTKIMKIKDICKNIMKYILNFIITHNIEKKQNKPKITIFEKLWGALDSPKPF